MRTDHSSNLVSRGAALGVVAGLLLASGSAATAADEAETVATAATAASSNPRPDCDNDSSIVAAQYLKKSASGLQPKAAKCKGADRVDPINHRGTYDGVCNNESKCSAAHPGDKIEVTTELSKSGLGVSPDEPVVEVISVVIVQVGDSTCYTYCTGTGGSKSCEKICD